MNFKSFWNLIKTTFKEFSEDKAARLAAALAYYTVFSLAPLLVIVVGVAGLLLSTSTVQDAILQQVQGLAGQQASTMVGEMLTNFNRPGGGIITIIIGVVTLLFGATGVFGQLQDALNTIWEVEPKPNRGILGMIKNRFLSFTMILGLAFLLMVSLVVSAGLSAMGTFFGNAFPLSEWVWQIINQLISIGVMTVLFALIFQVLPDVEIAWKDVFIGALVTSVLFNIGKFALGYYLGNSAVTSGYGAAGALIVILLWVYYTAQILFLGAEFTQVYARQYGSMFKPSADAQFVSEEERANQGMTRKEGSLGPARDQQEGSTRSPQPQTGAASSSGAAGLAGAVMPVVDQPALRAAGQVHNSYVPVTGQEVRERVRHEPPNPASVIPVIALGTTAGVVTLVKVGRKIGDAIGEMIENNRPKAKAKPQKKVVRTVIYRRRR